MELRKNERIDDLERKGYRIIQNREKFCFGVDAVLLSWFAEIRRGEKAIDLGTGNGIVPLLLDARNEDGNYVGLEIQEDMAEMAGRSVRLNEAESRIRIVQGDIKEASKLFGKSTFDVVTTNPPYMAADTGLKNPDQAKAIARHELLCSLDDVVRESALLLHPGGRFYMIHRPSRLTEILQKMKEYKLAPSRICMVHPYVDKDATMVLVYGKKGGRDILKIDPPVVVYEKPGVYTPMIAEIYGDGRH